MPRQIRSGVSVTPFMLSRRLQIFLSLVFAVAASLSAFGQRSGPKEAVAAFYRYDSAHSQIFNRSNIDARKRWFSGELYKLFLKELDREKEYLAKNPPNKPYFGDGLPFRPFDEVCELNGKSYRRAISFGTVTIKGDLGNVDVYFKYPKGCNIPDILYAVNMSKEHGRWVIDDIRYIADNTSLVEDLKRAEY